MGNFTIQKKKLYEEVLEQIVKLIASRDYRIGDRLPSVQELSEMFEVGKPTLREALSVLAASGILEIRHGSGIFVKRIGGEPEVEMQAYLGRVESENLLFWLEFRRAIEIETAYLAAKRRDQDDLKRIEETQHLLTHEISQGGVGADWDYHFHEQIARATHNPIFSQVITMTADILKKYFEMSLRQSMALPSRRGVVTHEHEEILEQIRLGNPEKAREAMLKHIENVEEKVKRFRDLERE